MIKKENKNFRKMFIVTEYAALRLSADIAERLCNSYTMGCPPVRGDNPRALASGLSYVQVDKHGITIFIPPSSV